MVPTRPSALLCPWLPLPFSVFTTFGGGCVRTAHPWNVCLLLVTGERTSLCLHQRAHGKGCEPTDLGRGVGLCAGKKLSWCRGLTLASEADGGTECSPMVRRSAACLHLFAGPHAVPLVQVLW